MKQHVLLLGLFASFSLAACGGGTGAPGTPYGGGSQPTPVPTGAAAPLTTTTIDGGPAFVDSAQHPVYVFSGDTSNHSNCTGGCLSVWPAVPPPAGTLTPPFGAFTRSDNGKQQLTYNGAPLYTFVNDTQPDVSTGNGVDGFSLARPAAAPTPSPAPSGYTR